MLERDQRVDVEAGRIGQGAAGVARADAGWRPICARKRAACLPNGAEALDGDARAFQLEPDEAARHVDAGRHAEAGGADLVERNAADRGRQSDRASGFVAHPSHAELVGSHVGAGDVVGEVADGIGKGAHDPLLVGGRHVRIADDDRLAAAVRQAGGGVLPGHRARQTGSIPPPTRPAPCARRHGRPQAVLSITTTSLSFRRPRDGDG